MRFRPAILMIGLASLLWSSAGSAETFPDRSIHIVVPFPAGGSNDVVARFLGQKLSEICGQTVIIDNRAGAGGNVGAEFVARSAPDGYTLLLTPPGPLTVNQSLYPHLAFDPTADFTPLALVASVQIVLTVNPAVKAKTVAELIALAKAAPGTLNFGSSGYGSTNHLAGELFKTLAGIDIVHVPYRGAAPAMNDLVGGQIPILFDNMPAVQTPGARRQPARACGCGPCALAAVSGSADHGRSRRRRLRGIVLVRPGRARENTAGRVLKILTDDVMKALGDADFARKLSDVGAEPGSLSGEAFAAFLRAETEKWGKVVKDSGTRRCGG